MDIAPHTTTKEVADFRNSRFLASEDVGLISDNFLRDRSEST